VIWDDRAMGARTSYSHGTFSWIDNPTTEQEVAKGFYTALFGWDYDDVPIPGEMVYSLATLRDQVVGAIAPQMQDERELGVPPHWNSYISVDDVDAVAARVDDLGGHLHLEPFDVMDAGRMAPFSDPTGAVAYLWQGDRRRGADVVNEPGAFCWNELATRDPDAAMSFYSELLGWTLVDDPLAPGVPYWTIRNGERENGGVRVLGDELPLQTPAHWLVYFGVDDIASCAQQATRTGGTVAVPKTDAGAGNAFAVLVDPLGAAFGIFAGRFDD
jgi:predicted enzyme related to lactoylglutathione lyase